MMKYTFKSIPMMIHLGVPDHERAHPQKVTIDVSFSAEAGEGIKTDNIEDVFDYFPLYWTIHTFGENREYKLLERLGYELKQTITQKFPEISDLQISITKTPFPEGAVTIHI